MVIVALPQKGGSDKESESSSLEAGNQEDCFGHTSLKPFLSFSIPPKQTFLR